MKGLLLVLTCSFMSCFAQNFLPPIFGDCCAKPMPFVEVRAGYFRFTCEKLNRIFKNGGEDVQLALSYPFFKTRNIFWNGYLASGYIERTGYSLGGHDKTHFQEVPVNLGLKVAIPVNLNFKKLNLCNRLALYATVGPRYVYTHQHNYYPYVDRRLSRSGCGVFVNGGLLFKLWKGLTLDFFGEYSYCSIKYRSHIPNVIGHTIDVGGYTFGGGLGWAF